MVHLRCTSPITLAILACLSINTPCIDASTASNKSLQAYEIREARDDEKPAVLNFLMQHFYPKVYLLNTYLAKNKDKIDEIEKRTIDEDFRKVHKARVNDQPSLVALHRATRKIVGINVMSVDDKSKRTPANARNASTGESHLKSKILSEWVSSVLEVADRAVDFFQLFPRINSALHLDVVAVDSEHGGKGLATALTRAAVDWGRSRKIDIACGLFTSPYSRRAAEKVGFKSYRDIDIMSFRDSKGNAVYAGTPPYQISVMALEL